jgi:formate hydrogenlyase subunit 3/multisubunit Na+/H+ antiporter MnhD subunit
MSAAVFLWIWLTPLLMIPFAGWRLGGWLLVLAPLPAVLIAAFATLSEVSTGITLEIPWLLLGVKWGLDDIGRTFLLVSSILWLVAALYGVNKPAEELQSKRYRIFFLLSMAGNLGLIISQDMVSFYCGFALMGLSAYGMINPSRTQIARYAARVYMTMTMIGEVALFTAVVLLTAQTNGVEFELLRNIPLSSAGVFLLIAGFGIKIGLPGLHIWLPLTYIAAPAASVAVLSSAMINAGILGLLRFLPPGNESLIAWGDTLVVIGILATFYAIVVGLLQNNSRAVLAYSSISKMGTLTLGIGLALNSPQAAPLLFTAIVLYASHHAFVKCALFLGADLFSRAQSQWFFLSLCFLALALAGAPLTSGAVAKVMLKDAIPLGWHSLSQVLLIAGFATTLLMGRFIFLIWNTHDKQTGTPATNVFSITAYFTLVLIIVVVPMLGMPANKLMSGAIPIAIGVAVVGAVWFSPPHLLQRYLIDIPPGDILRVVNWLFTYGKTKVQHLIFHFDYFSQRSSRYIKHNIEQLKDYSSSSVEIMLRHWELSGVLWLALCLVLIAIVI